MTESEKHSEYLPNVEEVVMEAYRKAMAIHVKNGLIPSDTFWDQKVPLTPMCNCDSTGDISNIEYDYLPNESDELKNKKYRFHHQGKCSQVIVPTIKKEGHFPIIMDPHYVGIYDFSKYISFPDQSINENRSKKRISKQF